MGAGESCTPFLFPDESAEEGYAGARPSGRCSELRPHWDMRRILAD
jgi:hypothetical protein